MIAHEYRPAVSYLGHNHLRRDGKTFRGRGGGGILKLPQFHVLVRHTFGCSTKPAACREERYGDVSLKHFSKCLGGYLNISENAQLGSLENPCLNRFRLLGPDLDGFTLK